MDPITNFLKNKNAIILASTFALLLVGIEYIANGVFQYSFFFSIFSLGSYQFARVVSTIVGALLLLVAFGSYMQNRKLVQESISKTSMKISEGAKELSKKMEDSDKSESSMNKSDDMMKEDKMDDDEPMARG